ncbi:MAG: peptidylglycine alpha-amidating monooxygenase [Labilithrix sp.]|nr:peptidylglycine alpha-amidating monooxygenase [Labilithrix sp.]
MRSFLALVATSALALAFAACGDTVNPIDPSNDGGALPEGGNQAGPSGLPCDVDKVLATNCRQCHASPPQFGAPMPLVTHADLTASSPKDASKKVYEAVAQRIADDADPMPPSPNARVSAADRATFDAWVAAGAPSSAETCNSTTKPDVPKLDCTPDTPVAPATPWTMPRDTGDEYVCYGVELTSATPKHVTGFAPRIDNAKIVHHIVLFEADQAYSSTPTPCDSGGSLQWRMVMGWAPGGKGLEMPAEAGFPIKTTGATHYVVQMHYSNPSALEGETDTSGFDLCTGPPRQYEADVLAFGTQSINIPPNIPPPSIHETSCSITIQSVAGLQFAGMHLFASMPHMHKRGFEMETTLTSGGVTTDLGTVTNWSFDTQSWLQIGGGSGVVTKNGDVIKTRCAWKNTTSQNVRYGEKTEDEMCYSFTLYYPKIKSGLWSWAIPAGASTCQ